MEDKIAYIVKHTKDGSTKILTVTLSEEDAEFFIDKELVPSLMDKVRNDFGRAPDSEIIDYLPNFQKDPEFLKWTSTTTQETIEIEEHDIYIKN